MKDKQYDGIDIMRLVCAVLVIAFHINPFNGVNEDVQYILNNFILNIPVPFFFICSGYFFLEKYKEDNNYIKIYVRKITRIYLTWSLIYLPWVIFSYSNNNRSFIYDFIIIIRNLLFSGSIYHLWYLVTTIYSIIIIERLLRKENYLALMLISILSIIIILGAGMPGVESLIVIKIYSIIFGGVKTGILYGIPFISIGILINKYNIKKYKVISKCSILIYLIFILMYAFKIYYNENLIFLLTIILLVGLFILLLNCKYEFKYKFLKNIRNISLNIYCIHVLILIIICKFEEKLFISNKYMNIYNFIIVTIVSFMISKVLLNISHKVKSRE